MEASDQRKLIKVDEGGKNEEKEQKEEMPAIVEESKSMRRAEVQVKQEQSKSLKKEYLGIEEEIVKKVAFENNSEHGKLVNQRNERQKEEKKAAQALFAQQQHSQSDHFSGSSLPMGTI